MKKSAEGFVFCVALSLAVAPMSRPLSDMGLLLSVFALGCAVAWRCLAGLAEWVPLSAWERRRFQAELDAQGGKGVSRGHRGGHNSSELPN